MTLAFFSTWVILVGQQINILGLEKRFLAFIFFINSFNIISVTSKSAITPSFIGTFKSHLIITLLFSKSKSFIVFFIILPLYNFITK